MLIIGLGYGAFSITMKTDSEIHTWDGAMELLRSANDIDDCLDTITKIFLVGNDLNTKTLTIWNSNKHKPVNETKKEVKKIDFSWWEQRLAELAEAEADTDREPITQVTNVYDPIEERAIVENILTNVSNAMVNLIDEECPPTLRSER